MKFLFVITLLFHFSSASCQSKSQIVKLIPSAVLGKNNIYLFCRGTRSKSSLIAQHFNSIDTNITHVGIGFFDDRGLIIYNVTDALEGNALVIDSLGSFINSTDVYYLSIWSCHFTQQEVKKIKNICKTYSNRKIYFDSNFKISNDDTLYCSEFCSAILNASLKFKFMPINMVLHDELLESYLKAKKFIYFPVDFFEKNSHFKKVFECKF